MSKSNKVISFNRKDGNSEIIEVSNDEAVLVVDGQVLRLESFSFCGSVIEEGGIGRAVMSWNCSPDESVVYASTLKAIADNQTVQNIMEKSGLRVLN